MGFVQEKWKTALMSPLLQHGKGVGRMQPDSAQPWHGTV